MPFTYAPGYEDDYADVDFEEADYVDNDDDRVDHVQGVNEVAMARDASSKQRKRKAEEALGISTLSNSLKRSVSSTTAYGPSRISANGHASTSGVVRAKPQEVFSIDDDDGDYGDAEAGGQSDGDRRNSGHDVDAFTEITNRRHREEDELLALDKEISKIAQDIQDLTQLHKQLLRQREAKRAELEAKKRLAQSAVPRRPVANGHAGSANGQTGRQPAGIDYTDSSQFSWTKELKTILKNVFGIDKPRLCQEGVLNAVVDCRDLVCIMPTGGGKSVCYQAPALLSRGCTVVISPLISLMSDQVMHLTEQGVEAVMFTGSTSKEDARDISRRLLIREGTTREKPVKLCYVTPEKFVQSKTFQSTLSKMQDAGLLVRIALDEAHCVSQLGHDFRPDYRKMSMLRALLPKVPIVAFTATCGKAVLNDIVKILQLRDCTPGDCAARDRTVFFSAPLYRPNLHYAVRAKPSNAEKVIQEMAGEILSKYPNDTGIIYTLSQKETSTVADGLFKASGGKIRTGIYNAGMDDNAKSQIHERWRTGKIKCVVATIAFGLGIDNPNVRYVFHHTLSKSMDGYYQESGRAGRDGRNADCLLWFRAADASRLSSMVMGEVGGVTKLHAMLSYALDYSTCRKLAFNAYFGNPASVVAPFAADDTASCGHCDNCVRAFLAADTTAADGDTLAPAAGGTNTRDATVEAWKICRVIRELSNQNGRTTLPQACDLVRGLGKGMFATSEKGVEGKIDLTELCDGKITLSKDDTEVLLLQLVVAGYLKEFFHQTAYATISYIVSGPLSARLTRLSREQAEDGPLRIELSTLAPPKKARATKAKAKKNGDDTNESGGDESEPAKPARKRAKRDTTKAGSGKSKSRAGGAEQADDEVLEGYDDEEDQFGDGDLLEDGYGRNDVADEDEEAAAAEWDEAPWERMQANGKSHGHGEIIELSDE